MVQVALQLTENHIKNIQNSTVEIERVESKVNTCELLYSDSFNVNHHQVNCDAAA
jgi:hypothetical protein